MKREMREQKNGKSALVVEDPTKHPCSVTGGEHQWNKERYGMRCLRCGAKVTGNPLNLWNRVVLKRTRVRQAPPPCQHIWTLKPYGMRCQRKRCTLKLYGDPAKLWKEHGQPGHPPPYEEQKRKMTVRARRRAEHREAARKREQAREAAARQLPAAAIWREAGLDSLGLREQDFRGEPAWNVKS
jgi:hypothetical protein